MFFFPISRWTGGTFYEHTHRLWASLVGLLTVALSVWLAVMVHWLTSAIGAATLLTYNLIYTPMKRFTWLNTIVGAVPGALPPVMGWTAARGGLSRRSGRRAGLRGRDGLLWQDFSEEIQEHRLPTDKTLGWATRRTLPPDFP